MCSFTSIYQFVVLTACTGVYNSISDNFRANGNDGNDENDNENRCMDNLVTLALVMDSMLIILSHDGPHEIYYLRSHAGLGYSYISYTPRGYYITILKPTTWYYINTFTSGQGTTTLMWIV